MILRRFYGLLNLNQVIIAEELKFNNELVTNTFFNRSFRFCLKQEKYYINVNIDRDNAVSVNIFNSGKFFKLR